MRCNLCHYFDLYFSSALHFFGRCLFIFCTALIASLFMPSLSRAGSMAEADLASYSESNYGFLADYLSSDDVMAISATSNGVTAIGLRLSPDGLSGDIFGVFQCGFDFDNYGVYNVTFSVPSSVTLQFSGSNFVSATVQDTAGINCVRNGTDTRFSATSVVESQYEDAVFNVFFHANFSSRFSLIGLGYNGISPVTITPSATRVDSSMVQATVAQFSSQLAAQTQSLSSAISSAKTSVLDSLQLMQASINANIDELDGTLSTINTTLGSINTKCQSVVNYLASIDSNVVKIYSYLSTLHTDLTSINSSLTTINKNILACKTVLDEILSSVQNIYTLLLSMFDYFKPLTNNYYWSMYYTYSILINSGIQMTQVILWELENNFQWVSSKHLISVPNSTVWVGHVTWIFEARSDSSLWDSAEIKYTASPYVVVRRRQSSSDPVPVVFHFLNNTTTAMQVPGNATSYTGSPFSASLIVPIGEPINFDCYVQSTAYQDKFAITPSLTDQSLTLVRGIDSDIGYLANSDQSANIRSADSAFSSGFSALESAESALNQNSGDIAKYNVSDVVSQLSGYNSELAIIGTWFNQFLTACGPLEIVLILAIFLAIASAAIGIYQYTRSGSGSEGDSGGA